MADVSVVTSGHDVADARLHRQVAALVAAGLQVQVWGLGDPAGAPPGVAVRTWPRPGLAGRATLAARMAAQASGRILLTLDPDSAVAVAVIARLRGRLHIVDVHEDYGRLLADRAWARRWGGLPGLVGQVVVSGFQAVARRADLTVVADDHVPPLRARQRVVERNVPSMAMMPPPSPPQGPPRAVYIGDVRTSRGLFAMVNAVREAPEWTLDVVGPVAAADAGRLEQVLRGDAVARRIRWHGKLPPRQAWAVAAGAWCGMALLQDTPAFRDAVPSKLYEYLACGVPVVTTAAPRAAALITASGGGVVIAHGDDAAVGEAVGAQLRAWSADPLGHAEVARHAAVAGQSASAQEPFAALAQWCVEQVAA